MSQTIKFSITVVLMLLTTLIPLTASAQPVDLTDTARLEAFFDGLIASQMEQYHVPGVTLAIVKDGQILLTKGYGYADRANGVRVNPDETMFRPGSISKLFIWTSVMQLVEEGRLDLDKDVNEYLDFEIPDTLATNKRAKADPITLKHLLTHTAGFEDKAEQLFLLNIEDMMPLGEYLQTHLPARVFPVGEQVAYSNYGSSLAAYIVERVSGQAFAEYVEQHIFQPLGMNHSTFRQPVPEHLSSKVSKGYAYRNGIFHSDDFEVVQSYPAGSLSSTAGDMARFMIAHLQLGQYGESRILAEATARQMHSQLFTNHPQIVGMAHGFIEMTRNNRRIITHGGDTFLFHSGLYLIPEENIGLFISYNSVESAFARKALFTAFMDRYFPAKEQLVLKPNPELIQQASIYNGTYYFNRTNVTTYEALLRLAQPVKIHIDADGYLVQTMAGQTIRYAEVEPGVFYGLDGEAQLAVEKDDKGRVAHLRLNNPSSLTPAPWYETLGFNGLLVGGYIFLVIVTVIRWVRAAFKAQPGKSAGLVARGVAILYGLLAIGLLLGIIGIIGNMHPVYGIPVFVLQTANALSKIMLSSWLLVVLGLVMIGLTVEAWRRKYWNSGGRIYYTLFTVWSVGIIWWFYYWNLLKF